MKTLFEYAILLQEKENDDGKVVEEATILVEPKWILSESVDHVNIIASREIPEEHLKELDRVTLVVRPF
jgi:hypothetical protein